MNRKIPSYSKNAIKDNQNIIFLTNLFSKCGKCISDLKDNNTEPILDGKITILDDKNIPFYVLSAQVKTLSNKYIEKPKYKINLSIYDFAERHNLPIIFILVNLKNNIAYWKYITKEEVISVSSSQKSKIFYFDKENFLSENNEDYIKKWENLCKDWRIKINKFDKIFRENERILKVLKEIQVNNRTEQNQDYIKIHKFLDYLNDIYNSQFIYLKEFLYRDCWKFGIAYSNYTTENLAFTCFPIKYDINQKQILKIDPALVDDFLEQGLTFRSRDNAIIKENFKDLSEDLLKSDVEKCIENKLFNVLNEFQANEILSYLIKEMRECLGLEEKNEYSFYEVYEGWFRYLPIWIDEVLKIENISVNFNGFINPSFIKNQLINNQLVDIDKKVKERIKKGELKTQVFIITHTFLRFMLVIKSLEYLQWNKILTIKKVYPKPIYPLKQGSSWVWEAYPKEVIKEKLTKIYENLAETYNLMVKIYFGQLYDKLNFFTDFDKIMIHVKFNKQTKHGEPHYSFYYLRAEIEQFDNKYFEIYFDDEFPYNNEDRNFKKLSDKLAEKGYKLILISYGGNDFIYKDTPVLDICYHILEDKLKKYFKVIQ
jgi:hypothetical protein